jgi:colanic acid/amylovoran biosynthesis glycosyltransferase
MKSHLRVQRSPRTAKRVIASGMSRGARTVAHVVRRPAPLTHAQSFDRHVGTIPAGAPLGLLSKERRVVRVGYVLDRFPRGSHGFVLQEILELESRGVDVHIFSLGMPDGRLDDTAFALARLQGPVCYFLADDTESEDSESDGIKFSPDWISSETPGSGMTSRAAHWVAKQIATRRIEHLHAHGAAVATAVVREAGRLTGLGYSFTAHADGLHDSAAPSLREKVLDAQFAVTLSDFDQSRLLRICGRSAAPKVHRIPMGVDPEECWFSEAESHDSDSILAVGPLVEKSGFCDLIEAIRILRDRGRVARLTILGEGTFEEALRARIAECRLDGSVQLLGSVSHRELAMLMRAHTLMVLPWAADDGDRDVLANLVLEAMAGGLLVLSCDVPSIRELIDDGLSGRVLSPCDPLGLAGALETLLDSPELRERMTWRARTKVERMFTARQHASHLASLFMGAVARKPLTS